jgi:transposase-like protein
MAKSKDVITQIRKATRRKFSAEEKIRIVLEGLRGESPISEICRREGIASSVYYKWSKAFLEAEKKIWGCMRMTTAPIYVLMLAFCYCVTALYALILPLP